VNDSFMYDVSTSPSKLQKDFIMNSAKIMFHVPVVPMIVLVAVLCMMMQHNYLSSVNTVMAFAVTVQRQPLLSTTTNSITTRMDTDCSTVRCNTNKSIDRRFPKHQPHDYFNTQVKPVSMMKGNLDSVVVLDSVSIPISTITTNHLHKIGTGIIAVTTTTTTATTAMAIELPTTTTTTPATSTLISAIDPTTVLSDVFGTILGTPLILAIPIVAALGVATLIAYLIVSYASPAEEED
jgi:hypothetical protein